MDYTFISKTADFLSYVQGIKDAGIKVISLDLEAEHNLHMYGEHLCLLQVFDGRNVGIIDPFAVAPKHYKLMLEDRTLLKVMYDASSDALLLRDNYDIDLKPILDLRPAVDLLEYEKRDLHSVIDAELGIKLERKKKFQKYNWTRRPLPPEVLEYASGDVYYLLDIKDRILEKLHDGHLLTEYIHRNANLQNRPVKSKKKRYQSVKGYFGLGEAEKAVFSRIFEVRDSYARALNWPPHNIIDKDDLLQIARDISHVENMSFPRKMKAETRDRLIADLKKAFAQ